MTVRAYSDKGAAAHAALLSRRPNLHAASVMRWRQWGYSDCEETWPWTRLLPVQADGRDCTADVIINSLPTGLRSLVIGEFALTRTTINRLDRCGVLP